jgi:O-antigen/teichoic acid export membrane protein
LLARPLLEAWLGPEFGEAAPAMTILVGYWILYANTSVAWQIVVANGRIRLFATFACAIGALNVALSLALTPRFGLVGVVLGTAIPYLIAFAVFFRFVIPQLGVRVGDVAQAVWLPAYSTALIVGCLLAALRFAVDLATIQASAAAGIAGLLAYWLIYYVFWLKNDERHLVRELGRRFLRF